MGLDVADEIGVMEIEGIVAAEHVGADIATAGTDEEVPRLFPADDEGGLRPPGEGSDLGVGEHDRTLTPAPEVLAPATHHRVVSARRLTGGGVVHAPLVVDPYPHRTPPVVAVAEEGPAAVAGPRPEIGGSSEVDRIRGVVVASTAVEHPVPALGV